MLVLSRKRGQAIQVESDIEIEILDIRKGRVRLGIRAPRTRKILRAEIAARSHDVGLCKQHPGEIEHQTNRCHQADVLAASTIRPCR